MKVICPFPCVAHEDDFTVHVPVPGVFEFPFVDVLIRVVCLQQTRHALKWTVGGIAVRANDDLK